RAGDKLLPGHDAAGVQHLLQRRQPAAVVAPALALGVATLPRTDGGDQLLAEVLPLERTVAVQGHRQAERPALPWLGADKLAVAAGWRGRAVDVQRRGDGHGATTLATPTMASRVTSPASSSSDRSSAPAGRSGSTMYRTSELLSHTRTSTSSSS